MVLLTANWIDEGMLRCNFELGNNRLFSRSLLCFRQAEQEEIGLLGLKFDPEFGQIVGQTGQGEIETVIHENIPDHDQTYPLPILLGTEKGCEKLAPLFLVKASARIPDKQDSFRHGFRNDL